MIGTDIFADLQRKVDEDTAIKDVSNACVAIPHQLLTRYTVSPRRRANAGEARYGVTAGHLSRSILKTLLDRSTQAILSKAHSTLSQDSRCFRSDSHST